MDEIICYTAYLSEGEERDIAFMELLLNDRLADGVIECSEKIYSDIGDMNHKLTAKQNYEFLLRAVQKYPLKAIGVPSDDTSSSSGCQVWEEYCTDCYILGKYQEELLTFGYYSDAVKGLTTEALGLPDPVEALRWLNKMISRTSEYYVIDDDTCPILIYQDTDVCHRVPTSFANRLTEALRACRQKVILWDAPGKEAGLARFAGQRLKAVIGIQSRTFLSTSQDGYFYDLIGGPKYNIILDHPIGLRNIFEKHPAHYYALVHDRNYQEFIKRYWPGVKDCFCFPPGGIQPFNALLEWGLSGNCANWGAVKQYDIIFIGSYLNYRDFFEQLYSFRGPFRTLAARFLHVARRNPDYPAEKALHEALEYYGISAGNADFLNLLEMLRHVISCLSWYYREKIVRVLLDTGIEIHVYGESWDRAPFAEHKCLIRHPGIDVEDSLHIMEQAKISLNIMSWHKDGLTERILNSMLAGAVVLSDRSTHLEEEFADGEDIVLFDLAEIDELPDRVRELLADDEKLKKIAANGRKKAMEKHLWIHRAKELLCIISENS